MTRPPLSDDERDVLAGRTKPSAAPFTIRDRGISREQWAAVELADVSFEDVDFEDHVWSGPTFRRCGFRGVSFVRSTLRGARFFDSTFDACRFSESGWVSAELERCRVAGGHLEQCRALRCAFRASELAGLDVGSWTVQETRLVGCRLSGCTLAALRFEDCTLAEVDWSGGTARGVKSSYTDLEGVTLGGVRVDGIEIVGGTIARLTLREVTGRNVLLSQVDLDGLTLDGCNGLGFVRVADAEVTGIAISASAPIKGFAVHASNVKTFTVKGSTLTRLALSDVDAEGPSSIEDSRVAEWSFRDGSWRDLTVSDTSLGDLLDARGTRFERLRFERARAATALVVQTEGVAYVDCHATWEEVPRGD